MNLNLTGSSESSLTNLESYNSNEISEKQMHVNEEPPYFQEKYEGKLCALCNLGERSHLGLGEMLKFQINEEEQNLLISYSPDSENLNLNKNYKIDTLLQPSIRRLKGPNKLKNGNILENIDEFDKIGYSEALDFYNLLEENKYYYVHRLCTTWSFGVTRDRNGILNNVSSVVYKSFKQKCSYCNHFGASVACKMSCSKYFHLPCVAASGGIQIIQNYTTFCVDHIMQVLVICADINITCQVCSEQKNLPNLVMCSTCGDLYHGTCIGLPQLPGSRSGWQCKSCNKCQICRLSDNSDGRLLSCEQCHKVYHANCLRPIMTSIPKCGWKCRYCRVCSDCGSRTPGSGASSRWHSHYTVCDSCYQQRNKGFSCPICHRAYRAAAHKEMVKCNSCNKFVHSVCDPDADLLIYHTKKENNPDYDYICPPCTNQLQNDRCTTKKNKFIPIDAETSNSQDRNLLEDEIDSDMLEKMSDYSFSGKDKMFSTVARVTKKRLGFIYSQQPNRSKGKFSYQKRQRFLDCSRKRGPKNKITPNFGSQNNQIACNNTQNIKNYEEPGIENRLILCSAKDKFLLTQDICVMCGAIGIDNEGCLISCTQCGQCYHPYCVNVKITTVIIKKGWRCLDCTVCEGCGQKNDESRLILCDECDISFHIYCMEPPLDFVPQGHWKCKWCAVCHKCGRNISGNNSMWKTNSSECGICFSKSSCPICSNNYAENDFIIKCVLCERWLHAACDGIENEDEIQKINISSYNCVFCRPKNKTVRILKDSESSIQNSDNILKQVNECSTEQISSSENSRFLDGVLLSDCGFSLIKSLQMEFKKKRKPKYFAHLNVDTKDAGIIAAIESVVSGGIEDAAKNCNLRDIKIDPDICEYDMLWNEGDTREICDNERDGQVLKKKRQRNLKKLGIGGFIVRNRVLRVDTTVGGGKPCNKSATNLNDISSGGKKRRTQKKDVKNKIWETYPAYLQEAFFGKILLNGQNTTTLESGTSDEEINSNVLDEKPILNENQSQLVTYNIKKEINDRNVQENLSAPSQLLYNQEIDMKLKSLLCVKVQSNNVELQKP